MFCQGKCPLNKKIRTYPRDSKSSFLLNSYPLWAAIDAYLVVPINGLFSLNFLIKAHYTGIWLPSLSLNSFEIPKSTRYTFFWSFSFPISIFSGFMSRWITDLLCTFSIICSNWSANWRIVFSWNFFTGFRWWARSFPKYWSTITLYLFSTPCQYNFGIPSTPCN